MALTLKPRHLGRYRDIARLLVKYGRSDVVHQMGLDQTLDDGELSGRVPAEAIELAEDLERMGPTFIKLGQLLSTRADLLPVAYTTALARLQDSVQPFPFDDVADIVESELDVRLSAIFPRFDREPLAAASLGQVHRAELRDGRSVAVKVQRPDIRERIVDDMEALGEIASFLDAHTDAGRRYGFADLLDQFRHSLMAELDYRREAANLATLGHMLDGYDRLIVPSPVDDFTGRRVLTMELVRGKKITQLGPLAQMEIDGAALADQLFQAYLDQILVEGFFHADPHPGNVFVTDDRRLALLDLGMVARIPASTRSCLIRLVLAVSEGRGESVADVAVTMGKPLDDFDRDRFTREVAELVADNQRRSVDEIEAGSVMMDLSRISGDCGLRPPPELAMLGKALLNLDQVAHVLDPSFQPADAIRRHAGDILRAEMQGGRAGLLSTVMEVRDFAEQLPGRVNKVMESLARGEFELKVQAFDEAEMLRGLQKLANRVTAGLVVAALVIGAALMMRIDTRSKLFGYPAIGIVCFILAAACGFGLLINIFMADRHIRTTTKRKRRR